MAWNLITSTSAVLGQSGGSTPAIDTTGADLLVVAVCFDPDGSVADFSDSKGNNLQGPGNPVNGPNMLGPFYVESPTVGTGHTFNCTGTNIWTSMVVMAFSGSLSIGALDQSNNSSTGSGTSTSTGSITPTQAGELIVVQCLWTAAGTLSVASGYTTPLSAAPSGTTRGSSMAYKVQASATAEAATWTNTSSGVLVAQVLSFKSAGAAAASLVPRSVIRRLPLLVR